MAIPPFPDNLSDTLPDDLSRSLTRRLLDGELPGPVYAAVGLIDGVSQHGRQVLHTVTAAPNLVLTTLTGGYDSLVRRGQDRSVELAAERAVRARVSRVEDRLAPGAARATVRWNDRRKRWSSSQPVRRAAATRAKARAAAERINEMSSPVLAAGDDERNN